MGVLAKEEYYSLLTNLRNEEDRNSFVATVYSVSSWSWWSAHWNRWNAAGAGGLCASSEDTSSSRLARRTRPTPGSRRPRSPMPPDAHQTCTGQRGCSDAGRRRWSTDSAPTLRPPCSVLAVRCSQTGQREFDATRSVRKFRASLQTRINNWITHTRHRRLDFMFTAHNI